MADFRNVFKTEPADGYWNVGHTREHLKQHPEEFYVAPFRMAPHVWMVAGQPDNGSYLIDTGEGLILIDAPYEAGWENQKRAIREAGFDVKDIRHLWISHPHFDHYGAAQSVKDETGCDIWLSRDGNEWFERRKATGKLHASDGGKDAFPIDRFYDDYFPFTMGRFTFRFEPHNGHAQGAAVIFFEDTDEQTGKTYTVGTHGGIGTCTSAWTVREDLPLWHYYRYIADSLELADKYVVDITLPNHETQTNMHTGINEADRSDYSAFVDRNVWKNLMHTKAEIAIKAG